MRRTVVPHEGHSGRRRRERVGHVGLLLISCVLFFATRFITTRSCSYHSGPPRNGHEPTRFHACQRMAFAICSRSCSTSPNL